MSSVGLFFFSVVFALFGFFFRFHHVRFRHSGVRVGPDILLQSEARSDESANLHLHHRNDRFAHRHGLQGTRRRAHSDFQRRPAVQQLAHLVCDSLGNYVYRRADELPEQSAGYLQHFSGYSHFVRGLHDFCDHSFGYTFQGVVQTKSWGHSRKYLWISDSGSWNFPLASFQGNESVIEQSAQCKTQRDASSGERKHQLCRSQHLPEHRRHETCVDGPIGSTETGWHEPFLRCTFLHHSLPQWQHTGHFQQIWLSALSFLPVCGWCATCFVPYCVMCPSIMSR